MYKIIILIFSLFISSLSHPIKNAHFNLKTEISKLINSEDVKDDLSRQNSKKICLFFLNKSKDKPSSYDKCCTQFGHGFTTIKKFVIVIDKNIYWSFLRSLKLESKKLTLLNYELNIYINTLIKSRLNNDFEITYRTAYDGLNYEEISIIREKAVHEACKGFLKFLNDNKNFSLYKEDEKLLTDYHDNKITEDLCAICKELNPHVLW